MLEFLKQGFSVTLPSQPLLLHCKPTAEMECYFVNASEKLLCLSHLLIFIKLSVNSVGDVLGGN